MFSRIQIYLALKSEFDLLRFADQNYALSVGISSTTANTVNWARSGVKSSQRGPLLSLFAPRKQDEGKREEERTNMSSADITYMLNVSVLDISNVM